MTKTRAQTMVEYIVLIGIVTVAVFYMGPLFKRGIQSVVKVTADQIGNQQNADQEVVVRNYDAPVEGVSYLIASSTNAQAGTNKLTRAGIYGEVKGKVQDLGYTEIGVNEFTDATTEALTDLGYTKYQK